ncbi:hypothetical protein B0T18DRAFT_424481 [Schizothecium vesticola]|uniref:Uncharacterized protein n=1 Tax=Schizothecium vesticola TaxID=314040 RepID=A0AA40FA41_9PEZI|nr:hypothetical protein B0T18DRAFT_424481 [Schizothecium vesticola]
MTTTINTAVAGEHLTTVETPTSPSSGLALSRFEFETGKANEGTKILLVEWTTLLGGEPSAAGTKVESGGGGDWEVSWDGKPTPLLEVRDTDTALDPDTAHLRRMYYLLPPGASVPPLITIRNASAPGSRVLRTKPMPAIFPAELSGANAAAGRRGVLHTRWGKQRLAKIEAEIAAEMEANGEGVGLEIAMQERQWVVENFGLEGAAGGKPAVLALQIPQSNTMGLASPRSPIGGRLGEKLRGLKLATSPIELAAAATQASKSAHPRMQSLATTLSDARGKPAPPLATRTLPSDSRNGTAIASLDAVVGSGAPPPAPVPGTHPDGVEEDLFALPLSPRSPDMAKSPFSMLSWQSFSEPRPAAAPKSASGL